MSAPMFSRLLLVLALALAPLGAFKHALSHLTEQQNRSGDERQAAPHVCEACLAFAAVEAGAADTALAILPPLAPNAQAVRTVPSHRDALVQDSRARGPPASAS